jgi:putative protease
MDANAISRVWETDKLAECAEHAHRNNKEFYLAFPNILRSKTVDKFESGYQNIVQSGIDGILIRNIESYEFLKNHQYEGNIVLDHNVYEFNTYAKEFWKDYGVESHTASLELNYKELGEVGLEESELVVYGYLPMMTSAQCIQKTTSGCTKKRGRLVFKDRYSKEFTVKNNCDYCYNMIYNTSPLVLLDQKNEIMELAPKALRLHFTIEDSNEVQKILNLYEDVFMKNKKVPELSMDFTRGHFKRGIK